MQLTINGWGWVGGMGNPNYDSSSGTLLVRLLLVPRPAQMAHGREHQPAGWARGPVPRLAKRGKPRRGGYSHGRKHRWPSGPGRACGTVGCMAATTLCLGLGSWTCTAVPNPQSTSDAIQGHPHWPCWAGTAHDVTGRAAVPWPTLLYPH